MSQQVPPTRKHWFFTEPAMNNGSCNSDRCSDCISHYVCTCMKVTEEDLVAMIVSHGIADLRELRFQTGAGDGCMACRRRLQGYLDTHACATSARERVTAVALELVG